jgi:magnesium transporter
VDGYFPVIDSLVDKVEDLEEQIFERYNQAAIESIFVLKKDLLALRKVLAPERDVLNVLTRREVPIFEQHTLVYFQDVYDHILRVTDEIDTFRDLTSNVIDAYLAAASNRLNEVMKVLTSLATVLLVLTVVTGFFGQNWEAIPYDSRTLFWVATAATLIAGAGVAVYFRRRGWL